MCFTAALLPTCRISVIAVPLTLQSLRRSTVVQPFETSRRISFVCQSSNRVKLATAPQADCSLIVAREGFKAQASLPYSIPNLDRRANVPADISWPVPSNTPPSSYPTLGTASGHSSSSVAAEPSQSTSQAQYPSVPFPIPLNSTTGTPGPTASSLSSNPSTLSSSFTPGYSSSIILPVINSTSTLPPPSSNGPANTASTPISSALSLSPSPSNSPTNTTSTSTGKSDPVASNSVVVITVTPSVGPPIVVTTTVIPPISSPAQNPTSVGTSGASQPYSSGSGLSNMPTPTPQPSQAPAAGNESQVLFPALSAVDVTIDGKTYHLPQSDERPVEIMLQDGSLAQLLATQVVMRGQTLPIPSDLSKPITVGGQTIQAQPGQSTTPDTSSPDGSDNGGGGLFGFLGKVGGAAGSVAKDIGNAASGAASFASGAAGGAGVAAASLSGTFSGAANSANGVVSSLNGIQQSFPADGLSKSGMEVFNKAQNAGRSSANWMQSLGTMLQGFDSLKPEVQQKVRSNMADYSKPGGQLAQAASALKALEDFPWEQEAPRTEAPKTDLPSATATPKASESARASQSATTQNSKAETTASTKTSSTSSSSSSAIPNATGKPLEYSIITKVGTPKDVFERFVHELDNGVGHSIYTPYSQIYKTLLNQTEAEDLKAKYDFLVVVYNDASVTDQADVGEKELFHAIPRRRNASLNPTAYSRKSLEKTNPLGQPRLFARDIVQHPNAPYWKKMISSPWKAPPLPPTSDDPPYAADDSGGRGTTIYVLDDGFDLSQPNLAADGRLVEHFIVPNAAAFTNEYMENVRRFGRPEAYMVPEQIRGVLGHGTKMATIAGGKLDGISPNANLYLVKIMGQWNAGTSSTAQEKPGRIQPAALRVAFDEVRRHVEARRSVDPNTKSVINMSWGVQLLINDQTKKPFGAGAEIEALFPDFQGWCESLKIPMVLAAGNDPTRYLHEQVPQKFGTPDNGIITIGGVEPDGTYYENTTPKHAGDAGSMSAYAPARDVRVPSDGIDYHTGTSQAAAITSGMIAYLFAAPGVGMITHPDIPKPDEHMKKFVVGHAWSRVSLDRRGGVLDLNVIYNLARGDTQHQDNPCAIQWGDNPVKRAESVSACSSSRSATSSVRMATSSISTRSSSIVTLSSMSNSSMILTTSSFSMAMTSSTTPSSSAPLSSPSTSSSSQSPSPLAPNPPSPSPAPPPSTPAPMPAQSRSRNPQFVNTDAPNPGLGAQPSPTSYSSYKTLNCSPQQLARGGCS
ncbi:hypothetical protein HBH96_142430 [Parastagonospora nodorum]|nr:hypothetical protein HBH47_164930 [Parastagonospora nodorum]KAH5054324.1 hypothetical protein HBH96_142430 [Parastagonospora nodorum]KAH5070304.1 hypothetical protein HBH95_181660 [Parastagonospora nodorum]KAH5250115.1 hypothetical protein HBI72_156890 [Parastagonospora nodorum]KAH6039346.1 hypothetical protein HBI54_162280 [Parastagonospora nodorum]